MQQQLAIRQNQSLRNYNSFGFDVCARYFVAAKSEPEVAAALSWAKQRDLSVLVLGGGSNIVLLDDYPGLVLSIEILGIELLASGAEYLSVRVGAGENWHQFVCWCLQHQYYGLENLSLIPGSVGAAPIQNIGAYGVELCERFERLETIASDTGEKEIFDLERCRFGYRDSVFKREQRGKQVITRVVLRLFKQPRLEVSYAALADELKSSQHLESAPELTPDSTLELTPELVSEAVCRVRRRKLPDPEQLGNAGSFFKNPVVSEAHFLELQDRFAGIQGHRVEGGIKLAAGWLLEQAGWKGYREGDIGVHSEQSLVLVNYAKNYAKTGATNYTSTDATTDAKRIRGGEALMALAKRMRQSVYDTYQVRLEIEPQVYPAEGTG